MLDIYNLKQMILEDEYTCVLSDGERLFTSCEKGIRPLIDFIDSKHNFEGFFAADKIVGKAAALLYAYMGVKSLFAKTISKKAIEICKKYNIKIIYQTVVSRIINRQGNGICPMEKAVENIFLPNEALSILKTKLTDK